MEAAEGNDATDHLAAGRTVLEFVPVENERTGEQTEEADKQNEPSTKLLSDLLLDVSAFLRVYVVFPSEYEIAAAMLWVVHTHVVKQFETTPYLAITSAEKRSGKTRLLDVLELLVARSWRTILPSEAVVFRKVDSDMPTLLLDEVDSIYGPKAREHEGLRALLNAGHRKGVTVPRCAGTPADMRLVEFKTFCAKALAGIGELPDTVADRSIPIRMARRAPGERVSKFRHKKARGPGHTIRRHLEAWASTADLADAEPELPEALDDRAADSWEPLVAIADLAGGDWPRLAREAALRLSAAGRDCKQSLGVRLLADLRDIFERRSGEAVFTSDLLGDLNELEESPWGSVGSAGKPLSARGLASRLRAFGIRPAGTVRIEEVTAKGYRRASFEDVWKRYVSLGIVSYPSQRHKSIETDTYDGSDPGGVTDGTPRNRADSLTCDVVTDRTADRGETAPPDGSDTAGNGAAPASLDLFAEPDPAPAPPDPDAQDPGDDDCEEGWV